MSLAGVRTAALQPGAVRKTVLLLALVVTLVAGILAMHTLVSGMPGQSGPPSAVMSMGGTGSQPVAAPGSESAMPPSSNAVTIARAGDPAPAMIAMTCVLSLLLLASIHRSAR